MTKDHLVSGYYSGQNVIRDESSGCNHGGLLDVDSMSGGINKVNLGLYIVGKRHQLSCYSLKKDSGYYLFSPHADLHSIAADLAVNHTEYFFNQLRDKIGDEEFNIFLKIKLEKTFLDIIVDLIYNLVNFVSGLFGF